MRTMILSGVSTAILLASVGCDAPIRTGYDFDPSVDFSRYATYAWETADPLPTGDPRLDNNPVFEDRVHSAVERELEARGMRREESFPDLLVHYHASVRDRVDVFEVDREAGYDMGSEYGPGTQVYQYDEGMLVVDLVDVERMRVVWRGWVQADVTAALDNPEALQRLVDTAVTQVFLNFPPSGDTSGG
jgi:hypothetical protein